MKQNRVKEIVPKFYTCKLTYDSGEIGQSATTTPTLHLFRANSLFDPDLTGTGHQPRGFDQLATLYSNYKVSAVKVEVFGQLQSTTTYGYLGLGFQNADIATVNGLTEMKESKRWITKPLSHERRVYIKAYRKVSNIQGITDLMYRSNQDLYAAGSGANPAINPHLIIGWQHTDEATLFSPYVQVKITYYCQFYNRVHLANS